MSSAIEFLCKSAPDDRAVDVLYSTFLKVPLTLPHWKEMVANFHLLGPWSIEGRILVPQEVH